VSEIGIVLIVLMVLACLVVMGAMMLMMWRGMRHGTQRPTRRVDDASQHS
jgi:hypothetical protein